MGGKLYCYMFVYYVCMVCKRIYVIYKEVSYVFEIM